MNDSVSRFTVPTSPYLEVHRNLFESTWPVADGTQAHNLTFKSVRVPSRLSATLKLSGSWKYIRP